MISFIKIKYKPNQIINMQLWCIIMRLIHSWNIMMSIFQVDLNITYRFSLRLLWSLLFLRLFNNRFVKVPGAKTQRRIRLAWKIKQSLIAKGTSSENWDNKQILTIFATTYYFPLASWGPVTCIKCTELCKIISFWI